MRRSKEESKFWNKKIESFLVEHPEGYDVENIYKSNAAIIRGAHNNKIDALIEQFGRESTLALIKDITYIDRKLRLYRQGKQQTLKDKLQAEFIQSELR